MHFSEPSERRNKKKHNKNVEKESKKWFKYRNRMSRMDINNPHTRTHTHTHPSIRIIKFIIFMYDYRYLWIAVALFPVLKLQYI